MSPSVDAALNVLFLCTGNSARSIMADFAQPSRRHPGRVHALHIRIADRRQLAKEGFDLRLKDSHWEDHRSHLTGRVTTVQTSILTKSRAGH